jgi:outer membrane protein assembly factor BamD
VVDRYQTTTHAPEALYRLVESYLTLGLLEEAKRNGAVLGYNYPGDPWYGDAYKLLTSRGLRPATEPQNLGRRGLFRLPFRKDKSETVKPPAATDASATAPAAPARAEPKAN